MSCSSTLVMIGPVGCSCPRPGLKTEVDWWIGLSNPFWGFVSAGTRSGKRVSIFQGGSHRATAKNPAAPQTARCSFPLWQMSVVGSLGSEIWELSSAENVDSFCSSHREAIVSLKPYSPPGCKQTTKFSEIIKSPLSLHSLVHSWICCLWIKARAK